MAQIAQLPVYAKFTACIAQHQLLTKEDVVIAAVSGGADSVCLLLCLLAYLPPAQITVAHLHHGIRGKEADEDEAFVQQLCLQYGVAFISEHVNVPELAQATKTGIEETARVCRYQFLQSAAVARRAKIAVAHHQEDRAETVLMNIARGTSLDGLSGIPYQHGNVIRPILDFSRQETEFVCAQAGIIPRTDSTNLTDCTLRNRVRRHILPDLSAAMEQNMIDKLIRLSEHASRDVAFLDAYTQQIAPQCSRVVTADGVRVDIDRAAFRAVPEAIQYRLVRYLLSLVSEPEQTPAYPAGKDLTGERISSVVRHICMGKSGKMVEVGRNVCCLLQHRQALLFCPTGAQVPAAPKTLSMETVIVSTADVAELFRNPVPTVEYFDHAQLRELCRQVQATPVLRWIQSGDRIAPFGGKGSQSLQKFLIDRKIPVLARKQLKVVAVGHETLWIPGIRRSEIGRLTTLTTKITKMTVDWEDVYHG